MNPLTRRGIMQGLAAVAGLMTRPGAEAAKAAISIAEAPGFSAVAALAGSGSSPGCNRVNGPSEHSLATQAAIRILSRRTYDNRRAETVRSSIACFRSASAVNKDRWEQISRDADIDMHMKYQQILEWLQEGTIKL